MSTADVVVQLSPFDGWACRIMASTVALSATVLLAFAGLTLTAACEAMPTPSPPPAPPPAGATDPSKLTWELMLNHAQFTTGSDYMRFWTASAPQTFSIFKNSSAPRDGLSMNASQLKDAIDVCKQSCARIPDCVALRVFNLQENVEMITCQLSTASFEAAGLSIGFFDYVPETFASQCESRSEPSTRVCPALYVPKERLALLNASNFYTRPVVNLTSAYKATCNYPDLRTVPPPN